MASTPKKLPINRRGKWFRSYKKNILSEVPISFNQIEVGMLVRIKYHSERRTGPKESLYLVIEPKFQKIVHAIDLDYVEPPRLKTLLQRTVTKKPIIHDITKKKQCTLLEFSVERRALYDMLMRISSVDESFRRLHRDKMHIKELTAVTFQFPHLKKEKTVKEEQKEEKAKGDGTKKKEPVKKK